MYLRSLELQGFKSFPDKIKLDFKKGISAVVGPNGSGKSNIGDAMRWVMGEQSSKTLRGEKMEDVIFLGSKTRPKAGFAQVTLTIDNEERALGVESDLVSVSRKLYRNGTSEYMINGANVRLKDVQELFMDTGLGRDGYSIIGQGKIADIVSSKSTERREIFEEAAGISKFRYKKEAAERKLTAAEDNISRLNDILGELESRIGPLKKQSEKAKRFRVLDDEKRDVEISVWAYKLKNYVEKLAEYDERLKSLDGQYAQISDELDELEDSIESSFAMSAEQSSKSERLKEQIHEIELGNTQAGADIAVLENDIKHLEETIAQLEDQIEQSKSSKYFLETELEKRQYELSELEKKSDELDAVILGKEQEFSDIQSEADEYDKSFADRNLQINSLYLKKSERGFAIESAKNTIAELEEDISDIALQKKEFEDKEQFASSELKKLRSSKAQADEKLSENKNRLAGYEKLYESKMTKLEGINSEFERNDIKLRENIQKLRLLNDLENSMEGFAYSVKHIMKASNQGRISGVFGSVAQIISVEQKYSVAVETALGSALQNIVVENEDTAKRCIRLLKENKAGRATFLPVTSVKGSRLENDLSGEEGFVALACDLVKTDAKYSGVIYRLLGRICIAEDIDLAAVIARKYGYKFRIVTLDGQVINAGGSFTGGSVSKTTGILTRKNEIETLEKENEKLKKEHEELSNKAESLRQETAKISADIEGVKEQISALGSDVMRVDMEIKRATEIREQYENALDDMDAKITADTSKLKQTQTELEDAVKSLSQIDKLIVEGEAELALSQNKQNDLKLKREELMEFLSQLKLNSVELSKDKQACMLSIGQINESIQNNSGDSSRFEEKIAENKSDIDKKHRDIENIKNRVANTSSQVQEINEQIALAQQKHTEYDMQANKLRSQQKIKMEEKETLSSRMTGLSEKKNNVTADFDKLTGQLWDEYELTRSDVQDRAISSEDIVEANKRLARLKSDIKALGNVNLGAIEEYSEVSERYEFMTSQLNDVLNSKAELEELIYELTENMKAIFTENFEKINANFKKIFVELFGGGHGELTLSDPENVLECGIDIHVEPPGKLIKNLMSLSGGEQAFVAVAIYFSILKVSPSPFCLLDEIEAALDDVNVVKYAQYLHKFTDTTQFITITHRRGTMEEADVLYGVTMQEKGVSKLLKMDMADTKQLEFA